MKRTIRAFGATLCVVAIVAGASADTVSAGAATVAFTKTITATRDHLVNGADDVVDSRTITATVSSTQSLRDRQAVTVTWAGAHPTGGLVADHNSAAAAHEEYPVVLMECRGVDSDSVATSKQVSPQTCWTQTPAERFAYSLTGSSFPSYRMDRYASTADRAMTVGQPDPLPTGCPDLVGAHWIPFVAANGTVYPGGNLGCGGLAPEAANSADSLQPGNTTYGVADTHGDGSAKFVVQTDTSNASVGCSATVACTLEIIPIMGISCDAAGTAPAPGGMAPADQPSADVVDTVFADCSQTGEFAPGDFNGGGVDSQVPVTGQLWWSASNWRNRIAVPLSFAPSANVCDVVSNASTAYLYGSEALVQATQQWAPRFCLNSKLFILRHVQTSEPQAKNLLAVGNIEAAIQAGPPTTPFSKPTVQAPVALSGFAIAYSIDGADGNTYPNLHLNARLLAKLLTESYLSCPTCIDTTSAAAKHSGYNAMANNPYDMSRDPEFQALNPGIPPTLNVATAATLSVMSSDSDVMTALTSYINEDPEAHAWISGQPDPWGMRINPAYRNISLPVANWPLLDQNYATLATGSNLCLTDNPLPWLPLVASPVSDPSKVALNLQFDIGNSQIVCQNNGSQTQKLAAVGREPAGTRFILGVVALADAVRYQLNTAALQSQSTFTGTGTFDDGSGRTFVAPTDAGLKAAGHLLEPDDSVGTWPISYSTLRTDPTGKNAYPGVLLLSVDVPTVGLPAADARSYAQLLQFAAGAGQVAGLSNGQLPPGYLPLTATNGLGALASYTLKAAAAVAMQAGVVPFVSGRASEPAPTSSFDASSQAAPPPASSSGSPSQSGSPSASSSGSATPGSTPSRPVAVGQTSALGAGPLGLALPLVALIALIALGVSALSYGLNRR